MIVIAVLILMAIVLGGTAVFTLVTVGMSAPAGFFSLQDARVYWRPFLAVLFTVLGIISKSFYDELSRTDAEPVSRVFAASLRSRHFWLAIVVSPMVILSFFPALEKADNAILLSLLAYENGFFASSAESVGSFWLR